jgi:hypothetical protein
MTDDLRWRLYPATLFGLWAVDGMTRDVFIFLIAPLILTAQLSSEKCGWSAFKILFKFLLSDLFVARQRFVYQTFVNRLIGLPLYYQGQFQIASTIGLMG